MVVVWHCFNAVSYANHLFFKKVFTWIQYFEWICKLLISVLPAFLDYMVFKNIDSVFRNDLWRQLPNISSFVYVYLEKQKGLLWLGAVRVGTCVYACVLMLLRSVTYMQFLIKLISAVRTTAAFERFSTFFPWGNFSTDLISSMTAVEMYGRNDVIE